MITYEGLMADLERFGAKAPCGWHNLANPTPCTLPSLYRGYYCPAHRAMVNGLDNPLGLLGEQTEGVEPEERARGGAHSNTPRAQHPRYTEIVEWLRAGTFTFDFLVSMQAVAQGRSKWDRLTDKQVDAVARCKDRDEARAKVQAERVETAEVAVTVKPGWYVLDGVVYKVQIAVHGSGRPYAKRLDVIAGERGEWVYEAGAIRLLVDAAPLMEEEARRFGSLYGVCVVCGAVLTDEQSISEGIGPVCGKRLVKWLNTEVEG